MEKSKAIRGLRVMTVITVLLGAYAASSKDYFTIRRSRFIFSVPTW